MLTLNHQVTNTLEKLKSYCENFIYGKLFPVILCLFTLAFFFGNLSMVGFGILVLIGSFILIVYDDMTPTLPVLLLLPMTMRDSSILVKEFYPYFLIAPAFIALIINFIRFPFKKPLFDKLSYTLIGITITTITGGLFTSSLADFYMGIGFFLLTGLCAFAVHFVYNNKTKCPKKINLTNYFCYCLILTVNLACVQMVYAKIYVKFLPSSHFPFPSFCWANTAHIANLIIIALPFLCFSLVKSRRIFPILINLLFFYVCLYLTKSEACLFIALGFTPLLVLNVLRHSPQKNVYPISQFVLSCICTAFLIVVYFAIFAPNDLISFLERTLSDSGRNQIYLTGFELFIKNPIFGSGIGYSSNNGLELYGGYFHSTIIQALATTGIIGLIAYAFLYIFRIKKLTLNKTLLGDYALISFVMYTIYACVDNSDCNVILLYITLVITFVGKINEKGNDFSLPLSSKESSAMLSNQFCK